MVNFTGISRIPLLSNMYNAATLAQVAISGTAFITTLWIALYMHYTLTVKTRVAKYPDEWFPSVSAVVGDHFPERCIFQYLMALAATPRFLRIYAQHTSRKQTQSTVIEIFRTLLTGGWIFVTSSDHNVFHSSCMVTYVALTIFKFSSTWRTQSTTYKFITSSYVTLLCAMSLQLYQHNIKRVPGAYSAYAIFEWSFLFVDIFSDFMSVPSIESVITAFTKDATAYGVEIFHAMIFWTNITELPMTLWHFPLWNMGLSGHEIVLFVYIGAPLALVMLSLNPKRHRFLLSIVSMSSMLSVVLPISMFDTPTARLYIVALSTSASIMRMMMMITEDIHHVQLTLNGLLVSCVTKFAFHGMNPLWVIYPGAQSRQTVMGILCAFASWKAYTEKNGNNGNNGKREKEMYKAEDYKREKEMGNATVDNNDKSEGNKYDIPPRLYHDMSWVSSVALGSLFYFIHAYATDLSTLLMHNGVSSGNEIKDGTDMPSKLHMFFVLASMTFGANGTMRLSNQLLVLLSVVPTFNATIDSCKSIFAGITIARQIMPWMRAGKGNVAIITSTYVLLLLADTFTTAYAFVPGGNVLRERSLAIWIVTHMLMILFPSNRLFAFEKPILNGKTILQRRLSYVFTAISSFFFITSALMQSHIQTHQPQLVKYADQRLLTVGIWTIHFGLDNNGMLSHSRMENVIRKLDLDVVGLLETDTMRTYGGNRNMMTYLSAKLNMYAIYGTKPNENSWGCSMLSKYPIVSHTTHLLPSPNGELACAIHAKIETKTGIVDILVSHNGQEEDPEDRLLQTQELARIIDSVDGPMVFAGYLVTKPGMEHTIYRIMADRMNDIYVKDLRRWCQYIFYKNIKAIAYARITHGNITDTEIQTAKFWIGEDLVKSSKKEIVLDGKSLYSKDFAGEGWNGHKYQRWGRALYTPEV